MKVCAICNTANPREAATCVGCGCADWLSGSAYRDGPLKTDSAPAASKDVEVSAEKAKAIGERGHVTNSLLRRNQLLHRKQK